MANGKAGPPLGNKNGTHDRPWSDALKRALLADDGKKLRRLADKLIDRALEGDVQALREVADRIEGRVPQQLQHASAPPQFESITDLEFARRVAFLLTAEQPPEELHTTH